jgi:hypothetical protein
LANVSLKRNVNTVLAEKVVQFRFLPRNPSAFQQARRRALLRCVLLGRATIFGHEQNNSLQDSPGAGCPCEEGGDRCDERTSQLHNA